MPNFWKTLFWLLGPAFFSTLAGDPPVGFHSEGAIASVATVIGLSYWLSTRGFQQTSINSLLIKRMSIVMCAQFVIWSGLSFSHGVLSRLSVVTPSIFLSSVGIGLLWTAYNNGKLRSPTVQIGVIRGVTSLPAFIMITSGVAAVTSLDPTSSVSALGVLFIFSLPSFAWVLFTAWETKQLLRYVTGTGVSYVVVWLVLVPLTTRGVLLPSVRLVLLAIVYIAPLLYLAREPSDFSR